MIKRVTAMAGDALPRCQMPAHHDPSETIVPQSRLVVLGDNPRDSADSRVFGYVSQDQVIGVVMRRLT
jgi:signal peptidase I